MQNMTMKELELLTQKQIKEYVKIKKPNLKLPKKWVDKKSALAFVEKHLGANAKAEPKKEVKKTEKPKVKKDKVPAAKPAIERRTRMLLLLSKEFCTVEELAAKFGNKYKSVLDDLHAIRHNRADYIYMKEEEVLLAVNVGKSKVFTICKESQVEKKKKEILDTIKITE